MCLLAGSSIRRECLNLRAAFERLANSSHMKGLVQHPKLGNIVLEGALGIGTFAKVFKGYIKDSELPVAIKVFSADACESEEGLSLIQQEFDLVKGLSHPLICDVYSYFQWDGRAAYVMELVDGQTLYDHANFCGPFPEWKIRRYLAQLVVALEYLHKRSIAHRDLKCENVMIDKYDNIHIIDFGFAKQLANEKSMFTTMCGSPAYVAPEIIREQPYDERVDIWSLGVIIYALTVGCLPFEDENISNLLEKILYEPPVIPDLVSHGLRDLIMRMLAKNPEERISLQDIKNHKWMNTREDGQTLKIDASILDMLRIMPNAGEQLDPYSTGILGFTKEQKDQVIMDLQSGTETKSALLYKMVRKRSVCQSLGVSDDFLFVPVKTMANIPHMATKVNLPTLAPIKGAVLRQRRVHTQVITDTSRQALQMKGKLLVNYRKQAISRVENRALSRLTRLIC